MLPAPQIGYFLRLLLLRNRLLEGESLVDLIKREMATLSGAMQHAVMPLQDVVKLCNLPRTPGANSAFQALVTWDEEGEWAADQARTATDPGRV